MDKKKLEALLKKAGISRYRLAHDLKLTLRRVYQVLDGEESNTTSFGIGALKEIAHILANRFETDAKEIFLEITGFNNYQPVKAGATNA